MKPVEDGRLPDQLGEPFKSRAQAGFAFAHHMPWAKKWAKITDYSHLPQHVKKHKNESNSSTDMGQLMRGKSGTWGTDPHMYERDFDKNVGGGVDRDKLPAEDFAGPDRSFPIVTQADVSDALHSLGRTKHNRAAIKAKIHAIAKRKGFSIPGEEKESEYKFGRGRFTEAFS